MMTWLSDWWNGMSILQQCFAAVAIPATVVLFLQTILLLIGIGGSHDIDHGEFSDGGGHDFTDGHVPDHPDAYDSHDDAQGIIKLIIEVVASEIRDAFDADDHEEKPYEDLQDEIAADCFSICHFPPPKC